MRSLCKVISYLFIFIINNNYYYNENSAWVDYDEDNDLMVICDGCNGPFHLVCIGSTEIPNGKWFCQFCNFDQHYQT
jgi:hypothetical protein